MGEVQSTAIKPYQFVGYWGLGQQSQLEMQLTKLLVQVGKSSNAERSRCSSSHASNAAASYWGVAYLSLSPFDDLPIHSGEIIAAASASGSISSTASDSHPFDAWAKVNGQQFTLGREPFGHLPIYWTQIKQVIWFASSLHLLLPVVEQPQVSIPGLYGYSCFSYVPTPLTPVAQIFSVAAGTEQTWRLEESQMLSAPILQQFHQWQEVPHQQHEEAIAITELQSLLKAAVHAQISDLHNEPVGVFLSGGLDSSIVAALLVQAGVKVRAYSLDFGAVGISEYPYAEQVAEFLNIPLIKVDVSPHRVRQALRPTVQALDLPFGDGVSLPLFLLSQAASQETRVIFNGEGGDQLFAGWTNKPLIAAGVYQTDQPTEAEFVQQYLRTFHRLWGYETEVFQPETLCRIKQLAAQDWLRDALDPLFTKSLLHRLRRATLMLKGAQNIHPRATNLGCAHGLMVRSPFCNQPLAEWAFQISGSLHLHGSCEKYILKRAVASWLPADVVWRQKRGMGVPLTSWCLNQLWQELGVWLNPARLQQEGIWHPQIAVRVAAGEVGMIQGRRVGEILWLLLIWQIWRNTIFGTATPNYSCNHPFWLPPWLGKQYLHFRRGSHSW